MNDDNEMVLTSRGEDNEMVQDRPISHRIKSTTKSRHEVKPLTKIVMRHLPGRITKTELLKQLEPLPEYNYLNFVPPDWTLGIKYAYSRLYINFVYSQHVYAFKNKYDNTVFYYDNTGTTIIIEFAPFQRIPKNRIGRRKDDKCGTIEECDVYKQFLYNYESNKTNDIIYSNITNNKQEQLWYQKMQTTATITFNNFHINNKNTKLITTPLLDFIKQQKMDKQKIKYQKKQIRDKERKLRKLCDSDNKKYLQYTTIFDYK